MRINFNTVSIGDHTGYGNAARLLVEALEDRGVLVRPGSDVVLNFCMPPAYEYGKYTIGYTPWESTEVPESWQEGLAAVDALWTPANWIADVFANYRPRYEPNAVHVVPHGIEPCWEPLKHRLTPSWMTPSGKGKFTFLHVGEPAVRKGGDIILDAWHKAFKDRDDVELIIKCIKYPTCRIKDKSGSIIASPAMYDNVQVIGNIWTQEEMHDLYTYADCMVYPSRGEGFGLIPFEAMASGLPTIIPSFGMGDYTQHSSLRLQNSIWVESPETRIHPGLWMSHDVDEVIHLMETAISNYESISEHAFEAAKDIHREYSWSSVAEQVEGLIEYALR